MSRLTDFDSVSLPAVVLLLLLLGYAHHTQRTGGVIRNHATVPAMAVAALATPLYAEDWVAHLAAGGIVFLTATALALAFPAALGMGFVKLLVVVGLVLGPVAWVAVVVAAGGGAAESAWRGRTGRDTAINPVPHLAAGVVLVAVLAVAA